MMLLRWAVTVTSGVCAYPLDSVKRRMMMTAGEEVIHIWDIFHDQYYDTIALTHLMVTLMVIVMWRFLLTSSCT